MLRHFFSRTSGFAARRRAARRGLLLAATLVVGTILIPAAPATAAPGLLATFSAANNGSWWLDKYVVSGWTLEFDLPAGVTMGGFYNGAATQNGSHVTVVNAHYNGTVGAGASTEPYSPWFIAYGSGTAPLNCRINGNKCDGTADRAPSAPTNLNVTGRTTKTVSLAWTAAVPTDFPIASYDIHCDNVSPAFNAVSVTTDDVIGAGKYARVGYFVQWGIYGRQYFVKNLDTSGSAAKLTHINYAFANLDPVNLTCLQGVTKGTTQNPQDPDQGTGAGDGVADTGWEPLRGNYNQLRKLKVKYPNLKVLISIGGWTYSKFFSNAALTQASREKFVRSCIDIYLKGNLPAYNGAGGPGTAAGIFAGIDLDWEWPGAEGHPGNIVRPEDKANNTFEFSITKAIQTYVDAGVNPRQSIPRGGRNERLLQPDRNGSQLHGLPRHPIRFHVLLYRKWRPVVDLRRRVVDSAEDHLAQEQGSLGRHGLGNVR